MDSKKRSEDLLPLIEDLMAEGKYGQNITSHILINLEECLKSDIKTAGRQFMDPHSDTVERKLRELIPRSDLADVLKLLDDVKKHVDKQR